MYHLIRSIYLHATSKEEYSVLLLGLDNAGKTTLLNQVKNFYQTSASSIAGTGKSETTNGPDDRAADPRAGDTVPTVGQNVAVLNLPDMYIKIWDVGGQMTLRRLWTSYYKSCHAVVFVVDSSDLGTLDDDAQDGAVGDDGVAGLKSPVTPGLEEGGTWGRKWHGRRKSSYNIYAPDEEEDGARNTGDIGDQQAVGEEKDLSTSRPTRPRISPAMLAAHSGQGRLDECRAVLESVLGHPDMSGIPVLVLANKQDREDCLEVVRIKEGFVRKVFEGDKGGLIRDSRVLPISALMGTGVTEAIEWVRKRVVGNKMGRAPVMR